MEAVPRMFMLSLELKWSLEKVDFGPSLKQYIQSHYMEDPSKYNEEIKQLDQLRVNATNVTRDFNGISTLKKYYGQLHLLTSRFPITDGGEAAPVFTWIDTFHEEPFSHADATFEQACILYNLGVLHSVLGAKESRSSEEEMKVACTHFQCAAGAFSYLKDHFQSYMSPDISFDLMTIYINLMLGQAQECLLEKSMQDNRKSSLVSRISMQVIDYYRQALRGLEDSNISSLLGSRRSKTLKKTTQIKISHYLSIAHMYMSNQAEEQQKHGERVCWLQHAVDRHNEAFKISKGSHDTIIQALTFTKDVVLGKFNAAKKDNDFVYHDAVPSFENLPEIKGASLVKSLTFQPYDESIAGPDIFKKLVPMEAHEAASLYSEEKAKLLRRVGDEIQNRTKYLDQFMTSLQVDQLKLDASEELDRLPQALLEVCAALSVMTEPIKQLVKSMQELSSVVLDVDADVKELQEILDAEDEQESEFQKTFGKRPIKIVSEIQHEFSKYKEGHEKASRSNEELHKAMQVHIENIRKLAGPLEELQASLPSVKDTQSSNDKEVESKLRMLINKVDEMKTQRTSLETQLRDQLQKDDITGKIVTTDGGYIKELFEEELKKHSTLAIYIEQNLAAQDNILKALTEVNAAYADTRKMHAEILKKRDDKIQELIASYTVYDDLLAKSHKGIEFYKKLQLGMRKLITRTKGVVKVNQEERDMKMARLKPKPAQLIYNVPKPALPVDPTPAGPKLSDYWKPKSSGVASSIGPTPVLPEAMSQQYPGSLGHHGGVSAGMGSYRPDQSLARNLTPATSIDGQAFAPSSSESPRHNVSGPSSMPYIQTRMPPPASSAPMSLPANIQSHPPNQPRSQPQLPTAPHPSLPPSQNPTMSQPGPQPIVSQPVMPIRRPQMQAPLVPQNFSQSQPQPTQPKPLNTQQMQTPHSQPPAANSYPQPLPKMASNATQLPTTPPFHGIQAQPQTNTAMVGSVTTPIASPITQPPMAGHGGVAGQPQGFPQQQVPHVQEGTLNSQTHPRFQQPGILPQSNASQSGYHSGIRQSHPGRLPQQQAQQPQPQFHTQLQPQSQPQVQPQPQSQQQPQFQPQPQSQLNLQPQSQPQLQPQPQSQLQLQPQSLPQPQPQPQQQFQPQPQFQPRPQSQPQSQPQPQPQPQQPTTQTQYTITSNEPHPNTQPGNYPQAVSGHPGLQPSTQTGFQYQQQQHQQQQQQMYQHQQPISSVNQSPKASPQHQPPQNILQPNLSGSQQMAQPHQRQMLPNQSPAGSPQRMNPSSQAQSLGQMAGYHQQSGVGPSIPQQQQFQPQVQQQPFSQSRFSTPSPQQGSPIRQMPQGVPQGAQQIPPSHGQQALPSQQYRPGQNQPPLGQSLPGSAMIPQQPLGFPQVDGIKSGIAAQPPSVQPSLGTGSIPSTMGQSTLAGQNQVSSWQPVTSNVQQPVSVGQPSHSHYQQASGQWPQAQPHPGVATGQPPQVPPISTQQSVIQQTFHPHTHGSQFPTQQNIGYTNQSQPPQQGFTQPNQVTPGSGLRIIPPAGSQAPITSLPDPRIQAPNPTPPMHPGTNQSNPTIYPGHQGPPLQQPQNPTVPFPAGQSFQQPTQRPLNQVQQVNKALKEEQQRLPQPSLQPLRVEPSAKDLLSNSPDCDQVSLGKPLLPNTQTSKTNDSSTKTESRTSSPPIPQPHTQPPSSNEAVLADVFKQSGSSGLISSQPPKAPESQAALRPVIPGPSAVSHPFPKSKDPYDDKQTLDKFVEEVERFEKYVDGLGKQMLSGPTVIDGLWKELGEAQDRDTRQYSIAVARCYSAKNRHPDVMPYDDNRVRLQTGKDDYINASFITDLSSSSPQFIATQAPTPATFNDFWLMVYEQQVSIITMLVSQSPTSKSKADFDQYWPEERGQIKTYGSLLISLQSKRSNNYQTDRTFHLIHKTTKQERTVFQLQFTAWPEFGVPNHPADLLSYISDVNSYYMQQRSRSTPIVVHCNSGIGRTGSFCLIYSAVREIMCGGGIVDIPSKVKTLRQQRRGMVAEKEQLKFSFASVLCFAQQVLTKRGVSTKSSTSTPQVDGLHLQRLTSFDPIMGADSVSSLQSRISKMSVRTTSQESMPTAEDVNLTMQVDANETKSSLPVTESKSSNLDVASSTGDITGTSAVEKPHSTEPSEIDKSDNGLETAAATGPATISNPQPSLVELTELNLTDFSRSPPQFVPDVVESSQQETGDSTQVSDASGDGSLPSILADLTPQNFSIKGKSKQRFSKADFNGKRSPPGTAQSEDPLSSLDPLWTMRVKHKDDAS